MELKENVWHQFDTERESLLKVCDHEKFRQYCITESLKDFTFHRSSHLRMNFKSKGGNYRGAEEWRVSPEGEINGRQ